MSALPTVGQKRPIDSTTHPTNIITKKPKITLSEEVLALPDSYGNGRSLPIHLLHLDYTIDKITVLRWQVTQGFASDLEEKVQCFYTKLQQSLQTESTDPTEVDQLAVAGESIRIELEQRIESLHSYYFQNLETWKNLNPELRTYLAHRFFRADLPPISLKNAMIDYMVFIESLDDVYGNVSQNEFLWGIEILRQIKESQPHFNFFALNKGFGAVNSPVLWHEEGITASIVDEAKEKYVEDPEYANTLYAYFTENPLEYHQKQGHDFDVENMFEDYPPIPPVTAKGIPRKDS